ncbi:histidine N-alpha-methyltransferase-like [Mytilus californianus]|uniref:histidine N-alpha-methyltransferase-like n=1 Tax=Mytilus californianus TaxID=6549 RepID=UPI002247D0C1|nr:histidine N-alpha-methyltransferase-like [Mytilus californianus]
MDNLIKAELLKGLLGNPVHIPAWYPYDEEGSRLNDICMEQCRWYYFHRFEMKILNDILTELIEYLKDSRMLVDLGSGNATKTMLILDRLLKTHESLTYVPVDISTEFLNKTAANLKTIYGNKLEIQPIGEEYMVALRKIKYVFYSVYLLFGNNFNWFTKIIVWFGSLQSLSYGKQLDYLLEIRNTMQVDDKLLITLDVTDTTCKQTIELAYLDPEGYSENFHLNSIHRLNREMNANIDISKFKIRNELVVNSRSNNCSYVNVWIEAIENCDVHIGQLDLTREFQKGERLYLHEENGISCKYTIEQLEYLLNKASLGMEKYWRNEHVAVILVNRK